MSKIREQIYYVFHFLMLVVFQINCRIALLSSMRYDIVFITESWLNFNIPASVALNGLDYCICRQGRLHKIGGGMVILYKSEIKLCGVCIN